MKARAKVHHPVPRSNNQRLEALAPYPDIWQHCVLTTWRHQEQRKGPCHQVIMMFRNFLRIAYHSYVSTHRGELV
jgi:hypothetical protein